MKKLCSLLLSLSMIFALAATCGLTASAADVPDTFWCGFETGLEKGAAIYGSKIERIDEGIGGSRGALKIQNGANDVKEPQYGGVGFESAVNIPKGTVCNLSIKVKPLNVSDYNGKNGMFVFYHKYEKGKFHEIAYFNKVETLTDGWLSLSLENYTIGTPPPGGAAWWIQDTSAAGEYLGSSNVEFRAGHKTMEYLVDDLRVELVPGKEFVATSKSDEPVYLVNDSYDTENTAIGGANGTPGCRLVKPTGSTGDGIAFSNLKIKPGQAYKLSWYVKGTTNDADASLSTNGLYLYGYMDSRFTVSADSKPSVTYNIVMKNNTPLSDDWNYVEYIFKTPNRTVPAECYEQLVKFYPRLHNKAWADITGGLGDFAGKAGMEYYIDEVKVEELDSVYNGDFENSLDDLVYGHARQPGYKPWITETGTTAANVSEGGKNFARVTQTGTATDGFSVYVAMEPGETYRIKFDAKSETAGAKLGAAVFKAEGDTQDSTLADLTSEWNAYEVLLENTATKITSPKLTFTMTDGTAPLAGAYDIDNVSVEVYMPEYNTFISADNKNVGGVISGSAEFDGSEDFGFRRVFISNDGKTWGQLSEGETGTGASSSYTITEKDAGKYIRFLYTPGLTSGADYIYTPALRTSIRKIVFTGTWSDLAVKADVVTDTFSEEDFVAIVAFYNSEDEMIDVELYDLNDLMNNTSGTYSISCGDVSGATYAKAYLWNNFTSIAPYCVSDTMRSAE